MGSALSTVPPIARLSAAYSQPKKHLAAPKHIEWRLYQAEQFSTMTKFPRNFEKFPRLVISKFVIRTLKQLRDVTKCRVGERSDGVGCRVPTWNRLDLRMSTSQAILAHWSRPQTGAQVGPPHSSPASSGPERGGGVSSSPHWLGPRRPTHSVTEH